MDTINQKVGLITGCFDVVHIGHINLFKFAKQHVDVLIVVIMSDESIRISKGANRPITPAPLRKEFLESIKYIDRVIVDEQVFDFKSEDAVENYRSYVADIHPTYLFTNSDADKYYAKKEEIALQYGATLLLHDAAATISTTKVLETLLRE